MKVFATQSDVEDFDPSLIVPDSIAARLRSASGLVEHATRAARYYVDSAGKPSDPEVVEAFRDATCAQVVFWVRNGIDPATARISGGQVVTSKSMGGRSVGMSAPDPSAVAAKAAAGDELCREALRILGPLAGGQPSWL